MSTARSAVAVAMILGAACHAPLREPAAGARTSSVDTSPMPYGLTCDNCLKMFNQSCGQAAAAPIAAVVSDIRSRSTERDCTGVPGPGFPISCSARRLYQFGQVEFLIDSGGASASDLFEAYVVYPEVYTSEFESTRSEGPLLEADKRYVIFGYPDRRDLGFAADWYIDIACEIQGFDKEGAIP